MDAHFSASESISIIVENTLVPFHHYLRQPQRLVKAITEPKLMEPLSKGLFRLKMCPLNFMSIYHFQPTVILNVWTDSQDKVYLKSQNCEIRGIDYINDRFSLELRGKLLSGNREGKTCLKGQASLEVTVALPPPLWLIPQPLLEMTGNRLLKSILLRIKECLLSQLLEDYREWASQHSLEELIQEN